MHLVLYQWQHVSQSWTLASLPWSKAEELVWIPPGYGSDEAERTCLASLLRGALPAQAGVREYPLEASWRDAVGLGSLLDLVYYRTKALRHEPWSMERFNGDTRGGGLLRFLPQAMGAEGSTAQRSLKASGASRHFEGWTDRPCLSNESWGPAPPSRRRLPG